MRNIDTGAIMPAQKLWDFMLMKHEIPKVADVIIHLGNNTQEETMRRVADIWHEMEQKPQVVVSGKEGRLTEGMTMTEAEQAYRFGLAYGIPSSFILKEERATNTGDNIKWSLVLLAENGMVPKTIIAVQKPFMERRISGTFALIDPESEVAVTSPQVEFLEYPTKDFPMDEVIATLVGDISAIMVYGGKYQTIMTIPDEVKEAFLNLVRRGYTKHLRAGYALFL